VGGLASQAHGFTGAGRFARREITDLRGALDRLITGAVKRASEARRTLRRGG